MKDILLNLNSKWRKEGGRFIVAGEEGEEFNKRLLLLEGEIDGLLKRKINVSTGDGSGRVLDYSALLHEKESQIVEYERKIKNLENRLEVATKEIDRLNTVLKAVNNPNISKLELERLTIGAVEYSKLEEKYARLRGQMASFSSLFKTQLDKLRNSGVKFENEATLDQLLRSEGIQTSIASGVVTVFEPQEKLVQVPVQDVRTKELISILAVQMKKLVEKYPKLRGEIDGRLTEFFQQEIIDVVDADEIDRIVAIVKYVPEVVKVENVYAYSSEKSRKVEFHLRVLIKALLEQLEKIKLATGCVLDIDEGLIKMINQEILDIVSVDDILKIFRVTPKIVEVEKIVEKVVDRLVEVPQVVPV